ncbi:MAG: 4-hydroxythreonine-4-phosphate dehydrogenase PdxA [Candidatus Omnitrophica bacterium]|nr:4-hydroxythreonine-4-phosphate dehydrogenase PdxA [Candidatus Omnitrophota bacterium]
MPISRSNKPTVLITMGDPLGIGPEVTVKALASRKISRLANYFVIGDARALHPGSGKGPIEYIDEALRLLKKGEADALVTAPVNKSSIRRAGISNFRGQTEYLAEHTGTKNYAMMFVGGRFKVTLVTRHIALKDVPSALSIDSIYKTIILTHKYLKKFFGIRNPKIGVAGLNPHSGEEGLFGDEEASYIIPAIRKAGRSLKCISGPIPPDVVFYNALNKKFDAVISMYHDQGLIPFKMLYFKSGVNLTLGLPFIRTSPDHGTASDIAGKGIADPTSMIEAIRLACRLALKKMTCSPRAN